MPKKEKEKEALHVSPAKSMVDELDLLEVLLLQIGQNYLGRLTSEIKKVRAVVYNVALQENIPMDKIHDLRDMLTVLRTLQTRPEKSRRKDLKKIDDLICDLEEVVQRW